ncbi:MAG: endonuclease/exonuclease/phosphatase family protein [Oligoflexus sp.]|nr:endonuclease/exonuclease/phosphatase family protein [Oligoflexus sp.]
MSINVLSYNIHWGLSAFKRINVVASLSEFIHSSQPDIVMLQELWLPTGALEYIIVETLKEVWPHQICVATALLPEGEQGNGILSRHPIVSWKHVDMSFTARQARSFLHARLWIEEDQRFLSIICTHFGLSRPERQFQAGKLCVYINDHIAGDEALILAGDFNDWSGEMTKYFKREAGLKELFVESGGRHAKSFPAIYPLLSLDRIYLRNLEIEEAQVLRKSDWRGSSDHLPLAGRLKF